MLARLLRFTLAVQVLGGLVIGHYLLGALHGPGWLLPAAPVLLVLLTMLLVSLRTAWAARAAEPARLVWRALVGEGLAGIRLFVLRQPWSFAPPRVLPATGGTPGLPVLLVHGYMCNQRIWDDVVPRLRAQGHAVRAVNLEPIFSPIDRYAEAVHAAVQDLLQSTGAPQAVLIGHSMGGLACRAYMRAHGRSRVARLITLGTPHQGTRLAEMAFTPDARQMRWQSPWLQALQASETEATRALMRIAITPQDGIVYPQRAQVLPGVAPTVFEGIGHLQMCLDREVGEWVATQCKLA